LKILFVIDHLGAGGAEQQFVHIVNNVDEEKQVYFTEDRGVRMSDLDRGITVSGGYGKRTPLRSTGELKKVIESFKPDIVHSFLMYSCFITALTLRFSRHKPRFIAQEFSPPEEILKEVSFPGLKKHLLTFSYKRADRLITIARAVMERFIDDGFVSDREKVGFVHDGLNIEKYKTLEPKQVLKAKLGLSENVTYVCFVGSLVKRKGLDTLIHCFSEITRTDTHLLIVGEGPDKQSFEERASRDNRIDFLGYKNNAIEYIKASDLFVLPSLYEGLPNVIIEAMIVGTPVVASNVSGIPELIEHDVNGLLVPPGDWKEIKTAIMKLLDDQDLRERYITESRKRAEYFNIDRMARDYEALYLELTTKT
jgi:glycosyltransferase involved in cell wall biosynthesis